MAVQQFTPEELATEQWRDIPGYEGYYQASNLGHIRSSRKAGSTYIGRVLSPGVSALGYLYVYITHGSKRSAKAHFVHSLVAAAFLGPRPTGMEVNHIDNNRANARLSNLEYVTHQQNMAHAAQQGRLNKPYRPRPEFQSERAPMARLTDEDVINIRKAILAGVSGAALAKHFNVTDMTISQIKRGKNWTFVVPFRDEVAALGSNKTRHRIPRRCGRAKYVEPPMPESLR